jgi:hypothetical protein
MITKQTAVKIWNCYNEIESAEKAIADLVESLKEFVDEPPSLINAFGERCGLQLCVPSGGDSHRIFGINSEISIQIIQQHIDKKYERLEELKAIADLELKYGRKFN